MMIIDMLMMMMVSFLCFFSLCILYPLTLFLFFFLQLTLLLTFPFSTLPFLTRVWRCNTCKDCLVCIVGVIATSISFSTLPFMMRVRRSNARKDCLVCIVGVIASGHYVQGRDSKCKAYYYIYLSVLPVALICLTAHQNRCWWWLMPLWLWFVDDGDATASADEFVKCFHFFGRIMIMIAVLS